MCKEFEYRGIGLSKIKERVAELIRQGMDLEQAANQAVDEVRQAADVQASP